MKLSDYVIEFISSLNVDKIFCVTGGGAMHLNDSLGRSKSVEGIYMLHEQGASIAAEAYARVKENYGVCLVTSGPGGTNAVTGCTGAYLDSIPVIFISGQVKRADLVENQGIRQFGVQEVDIISIVKSITKYAVQIKQPEDIRYELEKAATIAKSGRPGPVWLDIPLDIQAMEIKKEELPKFSEESKKDYKCTEAEIAETIRLFNQAKRPVLMLGHGIRLAGAVREARELYDYLGVPVLTSWNGVDLIEEEHPFYYGRPGGVGQRHANFIQQNADFVLTIGTRLNLLATGYNYGSFLSKAVHIMVDVDMYEMEKKSVHPTLKIVSDAGYFIKALLKEKEKLNTVQRKEWMEYCEKMKKKYPVQISEQEAEAGYVSNYHLIEEISKQMKAEDIYQFTSSGTPPA